VSVETRTAAPLSTARPEVDTRSASLRAVYIIWYRDLLRYWRDRWRLVASLAQPLLFLIVFGSGLSSALGRSAQFGSRGGFSYIQFMYPGIIGMAILFTAIFGAMSIVWDREFGFFERGARGAHRPLGGRRRQGARRHDAGHDPGPDPARARAFRGRQLNLLTIVELVPLAAVLAFGLSAFGVMLASMMKSLQGFQVVMNFLMMPMFFLSGALFPLQGLPGWMTWLTRLDPASYGIDPLRRVVLSGSGRPAAVIDQFALTIGGHVLPISLEIGIMLAFGLIMLGNAVAMFERRD